MFAIGDMVKELAGNLSGRVVHVFDEIAGDEVEQIVTVQPRGSSDEDMRVRRLGRELTAVDGRFRRESDSGWAIV